ncbi:G-protein coupled receptor 151-like [Eublepharis macularius]|uniref:G-protein coupled receptor 151-like n=1 Tax=Eublepharis macularius TaxID=481883 RepID=A0AA97LBD9_EUBMA|nr:G-protein coupled receptor 151-like [Eublepharis macularius]
MNSSQALFPGGPQRWRAGGGAEVPAALPSVLAGLCLAGSAGNLLLLAVLAHELRRGKSGPANALLLNLCSADLLLALYCLPVRIATYSRGSWLLGGFLCRATDWLLHACLVAKSLSWAAVGRARYNHVLSPSKCLAWGRARLAGVLAALWTAALLLPLPLLLFTRLEAGAPGEPLDCVFQTPPYASNFMDVFSKVYPLAAYLAPAGFTWACYGRALRLQRERKKRLAKPGHPSRKVTRMLLCLSLLFQAMWLPEWVVWLWERHAPLGDGPRPPPALLFLAEVLLFLNSAFNPGVFMAASEEFREGLRSVWGALDCRRAAEAAGGAAAREPPQSLRDLKGEAAEEKVLPDVEHFWKDRRNTAAGEESDPVPWEHQCDS